jgi:hypothetical protein
VSEKLYFLGLKKQNNRSKGVRNCKAVEQLFQFHSSKEITAFDCFLLATVKIQQGNFKKFKFNMA